MKRRDRGLEAEADDAQRDARQRQRVARQAAARQRVRDRVEVGRAGRAVDHRQAVQQRRRADRADDQVLQPRLQRLLAAQLARAQHVQGDRQQLQADEQRDRVLRRRQQRHAGDRRQQQRVKLAVRRFARGERAPRQQHAERPAGDEDQVEHQRQVVDAKCSGNDRLVRVPLPDRQPRRRARARPGSARAPRGRAPSARGSARRAARSSRRPAARSAATGPRSRRAGLSGGRLRGS